MLFPRPYTLQEPVTTEVITGEAFLHTQFFLYLDLRGYPCMVNTRKPECSIALHPFIACKDILQSGIDGMSEVQLSRNIGRGHYNAEGLFVRINFSVEIVSVHPEVIDLFFDLFRVIHFRKFLHL